MSKARNQPPTNMDTLFDYEERPRSYIVLCECMGGYAVGGEIEKPEDRDVDFWDFDEPEEVLTDSNLGPATTLEERYGKYGYFLPTPKQREKKPNIVDTRKLPVKESYGDAGIFALNSYRNQLLSEIHNLKLERKRRDAVKKNLQVIEKIWDSRWRDIFKADELISAGFSEEEVNRNMAKMKNDYEKRYGARQFIERSENGFMPDDVRNHRKKKTGELGKARNKLRDQFLKNQHELGLDK